MKTFVMSAFAALVAAFALHFVFVAFAQSLATFDRAACVAGCIAQK